MMKGEDVPKCLACDHDLTVEYILIESGDFAEVIQRYNAENLQLPFQKIGMTGVFDFLQEIGLLLNIGIAFHDYL